MFFNLIIKFGIPDTRTTTINEISACISANNPYAFTPINFGIISPAKNNRTTLHPRIINEIWPGSMALKTLLSPKNLMASHLKNNFTLIPGLH